MEWWHIYLFTRLDGLGVFVGLMTAAAVIATIASGVYWSINSEVGNDEEAAAGKKLFFRFLIGSVCISLLNVAIPTQKEAAAIILVPILAKEVPKVADSFKHSEFNKEASQIPADAAKVLRLKLEQWIAEMEPEKSK